MTKDTRKHFHERAEKLLANLPSAAEQRERMAGWDSAAYLLLEECKVALDDAQKMPVRVPIRETSHIWAIDTVMKALRSKGYEVHRETGNQRDPHNELVIRLPPVNKGMLGPPEGP